MSARAISMRDLVFVRAVLIPRVGWVSGEEIDELVRLRAHLDAIFEEFKDEAEGTGKAESSEPPKAVAPC